MHKKEETDDIDFETLKNDINKLMADVSKMTQQFAEMSKDKIENVSDSIVAGSKNTANRVEKQIMKQKPIAVVGSSFGLGLLLGLLFKHCS